MKKQRINKICVKTVSFLSVACMLFMSACNSSGSIEDYPEPVIEVSQEPEEQTEEQKENTKNIKESDEFDEASMSEYDSLSEEGKFRFNPTSLNIYYKLQVKDNPKILKIARKMMEEVFDTAESFELDDDLECTDSEFNVAYELAVRSNPFMETVIIDRGEENDFHVRYFPLGTYDEFNDIIYGEGIAPEEAKIIYDDYAKTIEDIVNENLTSDNTEMERAEIIYKVLVENLECDYGEEENTEEVEEDLDAIGGYMEPGNTFIERVTSGTISPGDYQDLYFVMMNQLNVDCLLMGCYGQYHNQNAELLDKDMGGRPQWFWPIVVVDDKAYHCDIFFDKALLDTQRQSFEDYESEMKYFGMSDETREKSMGIYYSTAIGAINPIKRTVIPECPEDYKK